jgi:K+-transporting ATPase ATPase A chain
VCSDPIYFILLLALVKPPGAFMARVYEGRSPFGLGRVLGPVERVVYRLCGVRDRDEMDWKTYAAAVLLFNLFGLLAVYAIQRAQHALPLNPRGSARSARTCRLTRPSASRRIPTGRATAASRR